MKMRRGEGLNIVPFIDIMLVLLAIVLSISTFIAQGQIPIQVPSSQHSKPQKNESKMLIAVDQNNQIYLNDQAISLQALKESLQNISPQTLIELKSDKESRFEVFVQILNILKEKKHENFAITAQKS